LQRRRVVLSAFALSPVRGSEPGIGWNIAAALAAYHDVTVLTCPGLGGEDHRAEIEQYFRDYGRIAGLEVVYVEPPLLTRKFQKPLISFSTPFYFVGYAAWQRAALAEAKRLHSARMFDLAHQLTITSFREPGYLWMLGIPFVWGPIAGASNVPGKYFKLFSWRDWVFYRIKNTMNGIHKRMKMRSRQAARAAKHIFVTTAADREMVTELWGRQCEIMLDTGSPEMEGRIRDYDGVRSLRLVWSGLHVGRKALPLLLEAAADLKREFPPPKFKIKILGGGLQTQTWKTLAEKLQVDDLITWTGQLSRDWALEEMRDADAFVFTSLQEGTSTVVMEALALGLPVICHDACGMAVAINDSCGIKIPMDGPEASRAGFAGAIRSLMMEPQRVPILSAGALARAKELSWENKVRAIAEVYDRVM
jgi:glycosyltransferase involved in cell wall biosynthesis